MLIDDLKLARHLCFQSLGLKYSSGSELSWHQFFFISYCRSTNRRELDHIFLANPAGSVCFLRYKLEFGLREVYKFYQIPLWWVMCNVYGQWSLNKGCCTDCKGGPRLHSNAQSEPDVCLHFFHSRFQFSLKCTSVQQPLLGFFSLAISVNGGNIDKCFWYLTNSSHYLNSTFALSVQCH